MRYLIIIILISSSSYGQMVINNSQQSSLNTTEIISLPPVEDAPVNPYPQFLVKH